MDVGLRTLKLRQLRLAIQRNTISFPSPTPVFDWRQDNDVQWRMAHLFFIAGWSILALGRRYQVPSSRAGMLVRDWIELAIASGLVQEIPPEPQTSSSGEKTIVEFRRQRIPASGLSAPAANEEAAERAAANTIPTPKLQRSSRTPGIAEKTCRRSAVRLELHRARLTHGRASLAA
jgi:hypothetical protein